MSFFVTSMNPSFYSELISRIFHICFGKGCQSDVLCNERLILSVVDLMNLEFEYSFSFKLVGSYDKFNLNREIFFIAA